MSYLLHILLESMVDDIIFDENMLRYLHNQCDLVLPSSISMAYFHKLILEIEISYDINS